MTFLRDFAIALFWSVFAVAIGIGAATVVHPGIF
jgi:Na+/H+-dicarboxylate symporter